MNKKSKTIFFLLFCIPFSIFAAPSSIDSIAEENYWLQLGHYRSAFLSTWKSDIDEYSFFLAEDGKTNPKAELKATIDAFNGEGLNTNEVTTIACKYPARFTWLKTKVDNNWPDLNCPILDEWKAVIDPAGITLVFPTAFMNDPSSMFGHTLLRIDAKDQTRNKELVAFAVNFAADPDLQDNPASYAFKGLIGSYPGRFSLMPYYRKVREYNDLESRDIWEYKINFTEEEVEKVLLHLWELQSVYFDYYFIDENCSYQLLSLLQLANENIDLTSNFTYQAIPSDTVAVLNNNNLLQTPNYRPAFGTKLFHYSEQLSDEDLETAKSVMQGEPLNMSNYSDEQNAAILEMAYEWLNYEFYDQGLKRDIVAPRSTQLLISRSKLKVLSPFSQPIQPDVSPELGHGSSRFGLSFSNNSEGPLYGISYRLAYHDLLDSSSGFIPGAQISFLDIEANIDANGTSRFDKISIIDAMALPVDNRIFDSWSWNIRLGFDRQPAISKQSGRWFTQAGYGKSIGNPNTIQAYILGSFELNGGDITDNNLKAGVGTELGAIWQVTSKNKLALMTNVIYLPDDEADYHYQIDFDWNWAFERNWALRSKIRKQKWQSEDILGKLTLFHYF